MKILVTLATALSMVLPAGAAMAKSAGYNGDWPVTITGSKNFNGSHCVKLNDGTAQMDDTYDGGFQVISRTIVVFLQTDGQNGELATLLFSAPATRGNIGKGAFEFIEGGESYDSGEAKFGTNGGC